MLLKLTYFLHIFNFLETTTKNAFFNITFFIYPSTFIFTFYLYLDIVINDI